ncbi:MAG: carboxypeptidase-like regulatory domain-containing protein [Solirubrobacteraceae bacterium]
MPSRAPTAAVLAVLALAATGVGARAAASVKPASCPARVLRQVPANDWAPARAQLAPHGAAVLRLCGYAGLNGAAPLALERTLLVSDGGLIAHLVDEFDALPPYPKAGLFCPLDDGSQVLALLTYPGGRRVTVALDETGCNRVSNGDVVRIASGYDNTPVGPRLVAELRALTAPVSGDAHVTGLIRLCGGPAPSRCAFEDGTVTVLDSHGQVVAATRTRHARFALSLPPGTYSLVAVAGGAHGRRTVVLEADHTVNATVVVPII